MERDTICAIATAPGGAIGIVRLSGTNTFPIIRHVCRRITATTPPRTATFTEILIPSSPASLSAYDTAPTHPSPSILDEALVTLFPAPHSYTGEDCAEISCHGSPYILKKVLELLVGQGCRIANPGEFTQRAYLNGKLDLSQAEAVTDLIASTNQATHDIAMTQLRGGISNELAILRDQLLHLTSLLELELDFADHEDLEFADRTELLHLAQTIDERIQHLAHSFETGQALRNGIPVAIVGKTNVGKSTLLNALLRDDRAIVSDIHGTTRDTIEETMVIHGVLFRFIDTAGIRNTQDKVEKIGIDRTLQKIKEARIVIWLLDQRPSLSELDEMRSLSQGKKCIYVHNKVDLFDMKKFSPYILPLYMISAKKEEGIESLKEHIYTAAQRAGLTNNSGEVIITNARHYDALLRAQQPLANVLNGIQANISGDLLSEDLRDALNILAEITGGQISTSEVLENIFRTFCVGK